MYLAIVALAVIVVLTTAPRAPYRDGAAVGDEGASAIARGAKLFAIGEAIRAHGGEATPAMRDFHRLSPKDREELVAFLADL